MRINAGIFKGRTLVTPKGGVTRPTFTRLKQVIFNICNQTIVGADFLDLFAGAGVVGLEALSRGAKSVTFVEQDRQAIAAIRKNIETLQVEKQAHVMSADVFYALERFSQAKKKFDIIFADPPYGTREESFSDEVLHFVDTHGLLKNDGELFLEDAMEAYDEDLLLEHLHLKSKRRIGRALLRHYIL